MLYEFDRIEKDFGAMEAAKLTGVSQVMQRDWRRHGFLAPPTPGKRMRFSLLEMCILALTKAQVDAGKAVSGAHHVAAMSSVVALRQIELCAPAVLVEGVSLSYEEKLDFIRQNAGLGPDDEVTRYLFFTRKTSVPGPGIDPDEEQLNTCQHFATLQEMEENVQRGWVTGEIFDLAAFALALALRADGPLITYKLRSVKE